MPRSLLLGAAVGCLLLVLSGCVPIDRSSGDEPAGNDSSGRRSLLDALPADGPMPLMRTDFSDDAAWRRVVSAVTAPDDLDGDPNGPYTPNIEPVDDPAFEGATGKSLAALAPGGEHGYVILADDRSMRESAGADLTVVLVDLSVVPQDAEEFGSVLGREFRSEVSEVASIEANLSIANMDFNEFADEVEADGVFRGF